ncbi:MAG: phosphatidate cytidylyltransferase [Gammaproteobacteria bacterium]|nr:phosphatidate cytidylyltransferase [Gammaproteobacteria bacterium]
MLMQRFLTACILIPFVLFGLFYAPPMILLTVAALLLAGCGWEFQQLIPCPKTYLRSLYLAGLFLSAWLATLFFPFYFTLGLLLWGSLFIAICTFPASQPYWGKPACLSLFGWVLLPLCGVSLIKIDTLPHGAWLLLYLLLLIWASDTGAYFAGKAFGRHKLIPAVSPGKTLEGLLGGLLLSGLVMGVAYKVMHPPHLFLFVSQALATVVFGVIGDLSISLFKRRVHCKDTGQLLPGHGGLLDRLDSLIAAAPVFYMLQS